MRVLNLHGKRLVILLCATFWAASFPGPAGGDWPGLWGERRDAVASGPLKVRAGMEVKEIWRRPIGRGYSEVAVVAGRAYAAFSDGQTDFLAALDLGTGEEIWKARMEATYRGHDGSDDGPISTPVVSGGRVFFLDPRGKIFAFDAATGRETWRRDLAVDFGAVAPYWGFSTSPLPVEQLLLVQAGGAERHNLVALEQVSGKTVWSSHPANQNGYSSPVLGNLSGTEQVVAVTSDKVFAVNPKDGTVLWAHPSVGEPRSSPVLLPGDRVLISSWFESAVLEVTSEEREWKAEELWKAPILKANYSPTVYHQGYLYGMNGAYLTCVDPETGEPRWRQKVYNASLILVDAHLAVLGEKSGNFHLVEATPKGFREKLKVRVFNPGARSITGPVFVSGRFLLRNGEEMVLLEVVEGKSEEKEGEVGL